MKNRPNAPFKFLIFSLALTLVITACGADESPITDSQAESEPLQSEIDFVLSAFSEPVTADGQPLIVFGHVLDVAGQPMAGAAVEFWQTDASSVYDHPNDPGTSTRDINFQGYGTANADENGLFVFRTIEPAHYGSRPKHIHFKVKQSGAELLTSQFYFGAELAAAQLGRNGELILLDFTDALDANGNALKLAFIDIVVDTGLGGGEMTLTPSQQQGPYYPVVDVASFDNDLAHVE